MIVVIVVVLEEEEEVEVETEAVAAAVALLLCQNLLVWEISHTNMWTQIITDNIIYKEIMPVKLFYVFIHV